MNFSDELIVCIAAESIIFAVIKGLVLLRKMPKVDQLLEEGLLALRVGMFKFRPDSCYFCALIIKIQCAHF